MTQDMKDMTSAQAAQSVEAAVAGPVVTQPTPPHQRQPVEAASIRSRLSRDPARTLFPLLPLQVVLTVQAALSLRLTNSAFSDEALTLLTGRRIISGLAHGRPTGASSIAAYFSGQPFLYPVLAAAVDEKLGLEAVRVVSLLFMLGATTLLWSSTRALFARKAAIGAVIVFGLAGPTLFLGHFAVYDVPAVFLCAASLRILIATAHRSLCTSLLAVPTTVLAIATSYATALYLPVLALVAVFTAASAARAGSPVLVRRSRLHHVARGALFAASVTVLVGAWIALLGPEYRHGFEAATTGRIIGSDGSGMIAADAVRWGIAALILGLLGTLAVARRRRAHPSEPHRVAPTLLTFTLAVSVVLAPAYQLHIHTLQSLQKHIVAGLLFSSVAAGVALCAPLRTAWRSRTRYGVVALAALALAALGAQQSGTLFHYWPNSKPLVSALKQAMGNGGGHYLAESPSVPQYYTSKLPDGAHNDWQSTYFFGYQDAAGKYVSGLAAYKQAIADHYFKLVVLSHKETPAVDAQLDALLKGRSGYRLIDVVPIGDVFGTTEYDVWEADR